ncbi:GntR family transcriptional regulator [Cerasicoccus frondis]|uniref:GntR family transcriptional regulator n=1 Tax=Cerasicoccus frondis TaxID=490090 RepID=UPI002852A143|nr:GntR family transcriptional regulator [Cerasicoccus frondis]
MAGKRSQRIIEIKEELVQRVQNGRRRPGNWFFSNRELAKQFNISYQTAHRLITELCQEGYIHRTPASGTYVASEQRPPIGVAVYLHPASHVEFSYGWIFKQRLIERLEREGIDYEVRISDSFCEYVPDRFAIIWANRFDLRKIYSDLHYSLLIDQVPDSGLCSVFTDSIRLNFESAGRTAGELMKLRKDIEKPLILCGPLASVDIRDILNGFLSVFPDALVREVDSWDHAAYFTTAKDLWKLEADAVFSTTDWATISNARALNGQMPHIGFCYTNESLDCNVTNLVYPWDQLIDEAVRIYRKRSMGDSSVATQHVLNVSLTGARRWMNESPA